jgi:cell division protein FtsQ
MAIATPTDKRFRRAHVTPRPRRRFRLSRTRLVLAALLATGVLWAGYQAALLVLTSDVVTVTRIAVAGNSRLSRDEVLALVRGLEGRNMLILDLTEWRQKLLASPWVADAALRRVLPGTVDIVVSERQPIGIARLDDRLYLMDRTGAVIDEFGPAHADLDLPLVDGLAAAGAAEDARRAVDGTRAGLAVRLLTSLEADPDLSGRVSQLDVSDARDAVVVFEGDTTIVHVGDDRFVERLRSYLDLAPALRERVPAIDYVDVRFGERVYVRPQASGPRPRSAAGGLQPSGKGNDGP